MAKSRFFPGDACLVYRNDGNTRTGYPYSTRERAHEVARKMRKVFGIGPMCIVVVKEVRRG